MPRTPAKTPPTGDARSRRDAPARGGAATRAAGAAALALPALAAAYLAALVGADPRIPPTRDRVLVAAREGAAYLDRHCDDDGRFAYVVGPDGPAPGPAYNVLRHAGAIYGLGMAHDVVPDDAILDTMRRAAGYLLRRHVAVVPGQPGLAAVWSLPGEETGGARVAKLGGAALAVVALTELRRLDPAAVPAPVLRGLGEFLLFMMEPDGKFVSKWDARRGYDRSFDSLYYPGEAILALTRLFDVDGDPRWIAAAARAAGQLVESRRGTPFWDLLSDHWLLIATEPLAARLDRVDDPAIDRAALLAHARDLGRRFLLEQWTAGWTPTVRGASNGLGRTTPTATRIEGLVALHRALPADDPLRGPVRRAVAHGAGFLLATRAGADRGPIAGGFRAALHPWPGREGFNREVDDVRIDYVQHALSALVGHLDLAGRAGATPDGT